MKMGNPGQIENQNERFLKDMITNKREIEADRIYTQQQKMGGRNKEAYSTPERL